MVEASAFAPGEGSLDKPATDKAIEKPDVPRPEATEYSIPDFDSDEIIMDENPYGKGDPEKIPDLGGTDGPYRIPDLPQIPEPGKGPVILDENPTGDGLPERIPDWEKQEDPYAIPVFAQAAQEGADGKPHKDGPEDQAFDKNNDADLGAAGYENYTEGEFTKGDAGISGRKPTPDGVSVKDDTKIYWEDKRPSETENNSWRSTYPDDPIADQRGDARDRMDSGELTKDQADAKIIIAEHDDHYAKKGERWNDPADLHDDGRQEKLGIRIPDNEANEGRIAAIEKELTDTGRNPQVTRENGNCRIVYDVSSGD